jgi:hypothetical protein
MKSSASVVLFVLYATTVSGFAPKATKLKLAVSRLAKPTDWVADDMKKVGKDDSESKDWVADAMNEAGNAGLHPDDFVARDMKEAGKAGAPRPHKKEKKKDRDKDVTKHMKAAGKATDDWVARDMKQAGSAESPTEKATSMAKKLEHKLDERHEKDYDDVVDHMKEAGKAGDHSKDWIAQDMAQAGDPESYLDTLGSSNKNDNASYKRSEWQKKALDRDEIIKDMTKAGRGPQEWIAQDMKQAGAPDAGPLRPRSHEKTKNELIEEDMVKAGHLGGTDWVRENMEQVGKAESSTDKLDSGSRKLGKAFDDWRNHNFDDIAEDMKKAGREGSETKDWVATDMKIRGKADSSSEKVSSWFKKLNFALDQERKHDYDDIAEDMEKIGKAGDHSKDWVAKDMEAAGHGESLLDKIYSVGRDFSYKLSEWQKKSFDLDSVYKHMTEAGHGEPLDSIAQDMKEAGEAGSTTAGSRLSAPKKQLSEWAANEDKKWVAEDMAELGRADASPRAWQHRSEKKTTQKMSDLVAEDMRMVGKAQDESVVEDMKMAGMAHVNIGSLDKKVSETQKQRETKVFMSMQEEFRKKRQEAVMAAEAKEQEVLMTAEAAEDAIAAESMDTAAQAAEDALAAESTMSLQARMAAMAAEDALAAEADKAAEAALAAEAKEKGDKQHGFVLHLLRKLATPWRKWAEL